MLFERNLHELRRPTHDCAAMSVISIACLPLGQQVTFKGMVWHSETDGGLWLPAGPSLRYGRLNTASLRIGARTAIGIRKSFGAEITPYVRSVLHTQDISIRGPRADTRSVWEG